MLTHSEQNVSCLEIITSSYLLLGVKATEVNVLMLVGVGLGISSVLLIVVCIWCHRKRVRRREDGALPHHVHVCERGARFASVDSVGHSGTHVHHVHPNAFSCPHSLLDNDI